MVSLDDHASFIVDGNSLEIVISKEPGLLSDPFRVAFSLGMHLRLQLPHYNPKTIKIILVGKRLDLDLGSEDLDDFAVSVESMSRFEWILSGFRPRHTKEFA